MIPDIPITDLIPPYPLHWTTILHYLLLLGTIAMLTASAERSSLIFTLIMAAFALIVGADLYLNLLPMSSMFVLLLRMGMFGVPIVLAGMAPTEQARNIGVVLAILSAPILALTFLNCLIPYAPLTDPRIISWCASV